MTPEAFGEDASEALFDLPCACQNLRRATRVVTRIYEQELKKAHVDVTQFGLLTALEKTGGVNQKRLSAGLAVDSTTLTRTLARLEKLGWIRVKQGSDKRERIFSLTPAGQRQLAAAKPHWETAESRLRLEFGASDWKFLQDTVCRLTKSAIRSEVLYPG
jgi:DNA-binding MarR family transcriptional regulator